MTIVDAPATTERSGGEGSGESRPISITEVQLGAEEERLVLEVLRSGHLAQGPMVARLEDGFRTLTGCDHAVAVSSGTAALQLALRAAGIGPGDEVVTSPFTFVATLNAILDVGATARFADIDDNLCVDPASVEALVGPGTAALLPVHLYGLPADLPAIAALAARHGLHLVEDAAQAHGAVVDGRPAGSWGVGCFSLYATKNVTAGEGGVVTTNDDAVADRVRLLRNQGMRERYQYEMSGTNARLTDLQAAVGVAQLARLEAYARARSSNAARLLDGLAGTPGLTLPSVPHGRSHAWHQFTVLVTPDARLGREALADRLRSDGIGTGVYYPRLTWQYDCFTGHSRVRSDVTPRAAAVAEQALSLPVHPHLSRGDVDRIVDVVRRHLA